MRLLLLQGLPINFIVTSHYSYSKFREITSTYGMYMKIDLELLHDKIDRADASSIVMQGNGTRFPVIQ